MTHSRFQTSLLSINEQRSQLQTAIQQTIASHDRGWLLESARQCFLSSDSSEWLFLEVFRPAVETATDREAGEWSDIFLTRLQSPHAFPGGLECHRLAWTFLSCLGERHFPATFRQMVEELIPHEKDLVVFRAMGQYCRRFPEDVTSWGPLLCARADFGSEPDAHIRQAVWQTFSNFCREPISSPACQSNDAPRKLWEITGDLLQRVLTPPGERSVIVLPAAVDYLVSNSPTLFFQLWDVMQLRVDPYHEPDWTLRQSIWETLDGQDGSIRFQAGPVAHHLLDHHIETHPAVLRHLSVYGQQLG